MYFSGFLDAGSGYRQQERVERREMRQRLETLPTQDRSPAPSEMLRAAWMYWIESGDSLTPQGEVCTTSRTPPSARR